MDLIRLYLVNILRPVVEDPKLDQDEDEEDTEGEEHEQERDGDGHSTKRNKDEPDEKPRPKQRNSSRRAKTEKGGFKNIELLDSSGPKLIHGVQRWFILYQIIGQLNWLEKPLIVSIIYKSILIPTCVYIVYKDMIKSMTTSKVTDEFKNPIFVFISLSAAATIILLATLTFYNNLFNWCPLFKVLTTEKLCFVRREVQDIIGNKTMPPILCFYAFNCALFRMLTTKDFQEFVNNFNIFDYIKDLFVFLCVGYHLIGMCYTDFYIRICFGVWIIAMKTNLENRFAYLQKHQRVIQRLSVKDRLSREDIDGTLSNRKTTRNSMVSNYSTSTTATSSVKNDLKDNQDGNFEVLSQDSFATGTTLTTGTNGTALPENGCETNQKQKQANSSTSNSAGPAPSAYSANRMTLDDFKAKYKIDTMDEIQKNLNTMDDHLEVSRDFQNSSLVLITLSAFLTNGALLLLAYNLLANQGDYYHGFVIVLISGCYTITIFMCYIGDSWILYALESFVQTVEDEYFLQSANDEMDHEDMGDSSLDRTTRNVNGDNEHQTMAPISSSSSPADWPTTTTGSVLISDTGIETMPYSDLIRQNHQLFIIKKRDVLFCREFLNQFQNHLATPWSKLTVKVQLHMLRTFVTLIAAQIIFDREH
jgi:hypothetical protein